MMDQVVYTEVGISQVSWDIRLIALSTCGFCRRGQEFLESHGLPYRFIHLDRLPAEDKSQFKAEFKEAYGTALSYPALLVNDKKPVIGYVKHQWEEALGLPHEE